MNLKSERLKKYLPVSVVPLALGVLGFILNGRNPQPSWLLVASLSLVWVSSVMLGGLFLVGEVLDLAQVKKTKPLDVIGAVLRGAFIILFMAMSTKLLLVRAVMAYRGLEPSKVVSNVG